MDPLLPATHTVDIACHEIFPPGGIASVPAVLMKVTEQSVSVPLVGLAVKATDGFFLVGLSAAAADKERNLSMLKSKERQWLDMPMVYNNNRDAILTIEKGTTGDRAFAEAFAAWRQ